MDIFAHGLWTGALYAGINKTQKTSLNPKLAAFWGIFPDLFAFGILFFFAALGSLFGPLPFVGDVSFQTLPGPQAIEPLRPDTLRIFNWSVALYYISHSLVICAAVFFLAWLFFRHPVWELGGWFFHILIDIPTHTYGFFPTPFFWPISDVRVSGISWATPWFLAVNYIGILLVYLWLWRRKANARF